MEFRVRPTRWGLMKTFRTASFFMLLFLACGTAALCRDAAQQISAIAVRSGMSEKIRLRSTDRLPDAAGEARVERKGGTTEIEVNLESMRWIRRWICGARE